ncbi:hypothetical protein [Azospirillum sp. sgz301742]
MSVPRKLAAVLIPVAGAVPPMLVGLWLLGADLLPVVSPIRDLLSLVTGRFFDAQAAALLAGRLDVPCGVLKGEAFFIGDACYGYFGLTPSLLRIPLNAVCPTCVFQWARFMVLAALLLSYAAMVLIARRALDGTDLSGTRRLVWATAFGSAGALGSSLIFLAGNPIPYHEAILWGGAFALLAYWALAEYGANGRPWALAVAIVAILLALNGRISTGGGVVVAAGLVLLPRLLGRGRVLAATGLLLVGMAAVTPLAVNHLKFDQTSPPMDRQGFYIGDPVRLKRVKLGIFQFSNVPCTLAAYASFGSVRVGPNFPWIGPATGIWMPPEPLPPGLEACRGTNMDNIEPFLAIQYTHPALLLLAALGVGRARRWWPLLAGSVVGGAPVLLYSTITERYVHDLFPILVLAAALGLPVLAGLERAWMRRAAWGVVLATTVLGLHANVAASLLHPFPQPEAVYHLRTLQRATQSFSAGLAR